jgi:hypothetical protein
MAHLERRRVVHGFELRATACVISRVRAGVHAPQPGDAVEDPPPSGVS